MSFYKTAKMCYTSKVLPFEPRGAIIEACPSVSPLSQRSHPLPTDRHSAFWRLLGLVRRGPPPPNERGPATEPAWLAGIYRELQPWTSDESPWATPDPTLTLDAARANLTRQIDAYLQLSAPKHGLLVRALPGIGKTTIAARAAERLALSRQRVLYAGPRHDFFLDVMDVCHRPDLWYEWQPRQTGENGKEETCPYAPYINEWMQRGYKAIDFCSRICGWNTIADDCVYHAQKNRHEPIIFGQHQHVIYGHPIPFAYVIGDETPIGSFCREWRIPARHILPPDMPFDDPFTHLVHQLAQMATSGMATWGEPLLAALGGAQLIMNSTAQYQGYQAEAPYLKYAADVENTPYQHTQAMAVALYREAKQTLAGTTPISRIAIGDAKLSLFSRHQPYERIPPHLIWLDATANQHLYQTCFQRKFEIADAQMPLEGRVFQIIDRLHNKSAMLEKTPDDVKPTHQVEQTETIIKHICRTFDYRNIAIITYQKLSQVWLAQQPFADIEGLSVKLGHFFAARGTNAFIESDAIFIVGTPQPRLTDMHKTAKMLFWERDRPFSTEWFQEPRPYNYVDQEGHRFAFPTSGYWNDVDMQALLSSTREDEIVQAAHRIRPLQREADIWLFTNMPTELPVDSLLTFNELLNAPADVRDHVFARLRLALDTYEGTGLVTAEVMRLGAISRTTALKYMAALVAEGTWAWTEGIEPVGTRGGRPSRGLVKTGG